MKIEINGVYVELDRHQSDDPHVELEIKDGKVTKVGSPKLESVKLTIPVTS